MAVATAIWIPSLHWFFTAKVGDFHQPSGISTKARQLASRHLALWSEPEARQQELNRMRASNAEWDFMGRTFFLSLDASGNDIDLAKKISGTLRHIPVGC